MDYKILLMKLVFIQNNLKNKNKKNKKTAHVAL